MNRRGSRRETQPQETQPQRLETLHGTRPAVSSPAPGSSELLPTHHSSGEPMSRRASVWIPVSLIAVVPLLATLACSDPNSNIRVVLSASNQASAAPSLNVSGDDHEGASVLDRLTAANVTFST